MKQNLKLLLKTTFLLFIISFSLPCDGQLYERPKTDGGSTGDECPFDLSDGTTDTIIMNLTLANLEFPSGNQSGQNGQTGITNLPCSLFLGMTNGVSGDTEYIGIQNAGYGEYGITIDSLYTQPFSFPISEDDIEAACQASGELTVTFNLYCFENGAYNEYDYCATGNQDIIPPGSVEDGECSLEVEYSIGVSACCEEDEGQSGGNGFGMSPTNDLSSNTKFQVFNLNSQLVSSGTILNNQTSNDIVNQNAALGTGIYIILYQNDRDTWSEKVIKL